MIVFLLFSIIFIISSIILIYVLLNEKKYKQIRNKRNLTGCEIAHEILDIENDNNTYILLSKDSSFYDSNRDTLKLDEDSFDENSLYAIGVSALKTYEAIDKKNLKIYKSRDKLKTLFIYLLNISYILIILALVLNYLNFAYVSVSILILVSILYIYYSSIAITNIDKIKDLLLNNGFIDKDEVEDINSILKLEAIKPLGGLPLVIKSIFDLILP